MSPGLAFTDGDRHSLRPVLELAQARRGPLIRSWRQRHHRAGTKSAASGHRELVRLAELALDHVAAAAISGPGPVSTEATELGRELSAAEVAFEESVESLHALLQTIVEKLGDRATGRLVLALDKVIHQLISSLAQGYLPGTTGAARRPSRAAGPPSRTISTVRRRGGRFGLAGSSRAMRAARRDIEAAAEGQGPVLIVGESGTGKELAARALHLRSGAAADRLVFVNCASLPRELVDSELFGHGKAAFTGASNSHEGLVRAASGGTLVLDEVAEMPADLQAKLLRVLETSSVRPVGEEGELAVPLRFVASTNRDPQAAVQAGALREDIYHRLNVHRIRMPPLREHIQDIPELLEHFVKLFVTRGLRRIAGFDDEVIALLERHRWPGNVRELRNAVEVALASGTNETVQPEDLPPYLTAAASEGIQLAGGEHIPTVEEAERRLIERALVATGGNKRQAAQLLGISRHRLYDRIRKMSPAAEPSATSETEEAK